MKKVWTSEVIRYLKAIYTMMSDDNIAQKLNFRFGTNFTEMAVKTKRLKLGLLRKKIYEPKKYTSEVVEFIKENYKGLDNIELASLLNEKFNLNVTNNAVQIFKANYKRRYGIDLSSGINRGCIKKGAVSWNKGTKGLMKSNSGSFKKGNVPQNHRKVHEERINKDGFIEIKIKEPSLWMLKHRYIWEQSNGKIPPKHNIIFLDGDRTNCDLKNLKLVSNHDNLVMNEYKLRYKNKESTLMATTLAKVIVATRKKYKNEE